MMLTDEQQLGRAKNAILSFLERRLSVPKIYIDADWVDERVDILAIDRDGIGDVHVVLVFVQQHDDEEAGALQKETQVLESALKRVMRIPAQFRYLAAVDVSKLGATAPFGLTEALVVRATSSDGLGRVGYLTVSFGAYGQPLLDVAIRPERFRAAVGQLADHYVQTHTADWELRA